MKITFLGATEEVTGSNYLLEHNGVKFLVDCGMWQGGQLAELRNHDPFQYNPREINFLVLTHAHLDHCGRIPKLYKDGFRGKIICTPPTMDLTKLILEDAVKIMADEAERDNVGSLYETSDVQAVMELFSGVEYNKLFEEKGIKIRLRDAGHILGSAIVEIFWDGKKLVMSGDFGNDPVPILESPTVIDEADYAVIESTYADRVHEDFQSREYLLEKVITDIIKRKGVLMIPAFSVERTQELLYALNMLSDGKKLPRIPVFLDSPLAIKATAVYYKYPKYYDYEAACLREVGEDFFNFPGLVLTDTVEKSKGINTIKPPFIVIAGSGMLHGGRIRYHVRNYINDPHSKLLIIGYQVRGTLGRILLDGAKQIKLFGLDIKVRARVEALGAFSAHGDGNQLYDWLSNIKGVKQVFVTHGELTAAKAFAHRVANQLKIESLVPPMGRQVELL